MARTLFILWVAGWAGLIVLLGANEAPQGAYLIVLGGMIVTLWLIGTQLPKLPPGSVDRALIWPWGAFPEPGRLASCSQGAVPDDWRRSYGGPGMTSEEFAGLLERKGFVRPRPQGAPFAEIPEDRSRRGVFKGVSNSSREVEPNGDESGSFSVGLLKGDRLVLDIPANDYRSDIYDIRGHTTCDLSICPWILVAGKTLYLFSLDLEYGEPQPGAAYVSEDGGETWSAALAPKTPLEPSRLRRIAIG
jgi:hypothetical protein